MQIFLNSQDGIKHSRDPKNGTPIIKHQSNNTVFESFLQN